MEEIYVNAVYCKPETNPTPSSTNQIGHRSPERKCHGAVIVGLVLLSLLLMAGFITFAVLYHDSVSGSARLSTIEANLTELLKTSNERLSSLSEERDLLNASLTERTEEVHRLQRLSKQKETCPAGWKMFSCTCYLLSTTTLSWDKARQDCKNKGGDLVTINTAEEQESLAAWIKQDTWIGLNDRDSEGQWKWTDGTPLTVTYWESRQPDNGGGDPQWGEEDCAHFTINREWNDRRCSDALQWICEKL